MQDAQRRECSCMDSRHLVSHNVLRGDEGKGDAAFVVRMDDGPVVYA